MHIASINNEARTIGGTGQSFSDPDFLFDPSFAFCFAFIFHF
jgi:hypothetical protein